MKRTVKKAVGRANASARRRMRAGWIAMGALAASAMVAGPAAAQPQSAKHGRGSRDAAATAPARRIDWPEFRGSLVTWSYQDSTSAIQQGGGLGPAQAKAPLRFDITPGPLGTALTSFEQVTGLRVEVPNDNLRSLHSPGVSGVYSAEQAIAQLLSGTGVSYRFTGPRTVALDLRIQADAVEVTGRMPSCLLYTSPSPRD